MTDHAPRKLAKQRASLKKERKATVRAYSTEITTLGKLRKFLEVFKDWPEDSPCEYSIRIWGERKS